MMMPRLLVIGTSVDGHIDAVLEHLPPTVLVTRLDVDRLSSIRISIIPGPRHGSILSPTETVDLSSIHTVWFRRMGQPGIPATVTTPAHRAFAIGESEAGVIALADALVGARWCNEYWAARKALQKIQQLTKAQKHGFRIPDTIVTNDAIEARSFFEKHAGRIVYKTLVKPSIQYANHRTFVYTSRVSASDLLDDAAVSVAPCQFQEEITKNYELRVTYAYGDMWAVAIGSTQLSERGQVDWRYDLPTAPYTTTSLPLFIRDSLRSLMMELRLEYGAIDMIVTPEGEYVFLEVNPHGAWLWLERRLSLPISRRLADGLADGLIE